MTGRRAVVVVATLLAGLAVLAFLGWRYAGGSLDVRPGAHSLRPDDAAVLAQGLQIYTTHCAACHGARLEGQPNWRERGADGRLPAPPHDASGHTWHHPDEVLVRITRDGVATVANMPDYVTSMPVYKGVLGDDDIVAVLSWIKSQWPPAIRAKHDQINQQARAQAP
jgi:mono/diheme cytochrome c family protein